MSQTDIAFLVGLITTPIAMAFGMAVVAFIEWIEKLALGRRLKQYQAQKAVDKILLTFEPEYPALVAEMRKKVSDEKV